MAQTSAKRQRSTKISSRSLECVTAWGFMSVNWFSTDSSVWTLCLARIQDLYLGAMPPNFVKRKNAVPLTRVLFIYFLLFFFFCFFCFCFCFFFSSFGRACQSGQSHPEIFIVIVVIIFMSLSLHATVIVTRPSQPQPNLPVSPLVTDILSLTGG